MKADVINVRFSGLGGMGVLKASYLLAQTAFRAGCDVKKADVHGMAQRGGSLASDVRFGPRVLSPMIPRGQVDVLVALAPEWAHLHTPDLRPGGILITPEQVDAAALPSRKAVNVALLGILSRHLEFTESLWLDAIRGAFPAALAEANVHAFRAGRALSGGPAAAPGGERQEESR